MFHLLMGNILHLRLSNIVNQVLVKVPHRSSTRKMLRMEIAQKWPTNIYQSIIYLCCKDGQENIRKAKLAGNFAWSLDTFILGRRSRCFHLLYNVCWHLNYVGIVMMIASSSIFVIFSPSPLRFLVPIFHQIQCWSRCITNKLYVLCMGTCPAHWPCSLRL